MKEFNLFYLIGVAVLIVVLVLNGFNLISIERIVILEFFSLSFLLMGLFYKTEKIEKEVKKLNGITKASLNNLEERKIMLNICSEMQGAEMSFMSNSMKQIETLNSRMELNAKELSLQEIKKTLEDISKKIEEISVK